MSKDRTHVQPTALLGPRATADDVPAVGHGPAGWICVACRANNPLEDDECSTCGEQFGAALRSDVERLRRRATTTGLAAREAGLVIALFILWKLASAVSITQVGSAFTRARWIWRTERDFRLPSELSLQHAVLGHPVVVQALNLFYLAGHLGGLAVALGWLFIRHRDAYYRWRNTIVAFTGTSLLIQLVSVAPPRLLPDLGFVDTAVRYHESAYQHIGPGFVDQLSSMPSIHVGWAVIIAWAVLEVSRSRSRWLVLAHPIVTAYAVVATANHFWFDELAALALAAAVVALQRHLLPVRSWVARQPKLSN